MQHYRERWHTENSVDFVPNHLRHLCDDSLDEILSDGPIRDYQLMAISQSVLDKYPSLFMETN